jgi:hypothetical protein
MHFAFILSKYLPIFNVESLDFQYTIAVCQGPYPQKQTAEILPGYVPINRK